MGFSTVLQNISYTIEMTYEICYNKHRLTFRRNGMKKSKLEKCIRTADLGDNASGMFVNYGVAKKKEGKYRTARILMILAYVAFSAAYIIGFGSIGFFAFIAILPLILWILISLTWRFVSIEYEYCILDGEFRMLKLYGLKSMRELCRVRVSAMKTVAPYSGEYKPAADALKSANRIEAVSSMKAADIYFATFDDDGEEYAVFFEATEKTLKVLKYYKQDTVVTKTAH